MVDCEDSFDMLFLQHINVQKDDIENRDLLTETQQKYLTMCV